MLPDATLSLLYLIFRKCDELTINQYETKTRFEILYTRKGRTAFIDGVVNGDDLGELLEQVWKEVNV